jgi:hypothetical protein
VSSAIALVLLLVVLLIVAQGAAPGTGLAP